MLLRYTGSLAIAIASIISLRDVDTSRQIEVVSTMPQPIEQHLTQIRKLAQDYGATRLEVFGSVCTPEFDRERSDIDFLVKFPPDYDFGPWLARLQDLETDLSQLLGRNVDVVTTSALRNSWFRREAAKTRTVIYDASEVAKFG